MTAERRTSLAETRARLDELVAARHATHDATHPVRLSLAAALRARGATLTPIRRPYRETTA